MGVKIFLGDHKKLQFIYHGSRIRNFRKTVMEILLENIVLPTPMSSLKAHTHIYNIYYIRLDIYILHIYL
jgi:hypothetical protein